MKLTVAFGLLHIDCLEKESFPFHVQARQSIFREIRILQQLAGEAPLDRVNIEFTVAAISFNPIRRLASGLHSRCAHPLFSNKQYSPSFLSFSEVMASSGYTSTSLHSYMPKF